MPADVRWDWEPSEWILTNFLGHKLSLVAALANTIDALGGFVPSCLWYCLRFVADFFICIGKRIDNDLKLEDMVDHEAAALCVVVWFWNLILAFLSLVRRLKLVCLFVDFVPVDFVLVLVDAAVVDSCSGVNSCSQGLNQSGGGNLPLHLG